MDKTINKLSTKLKEHVWCVMAFAALLLLAVITYWLGGKGNEIVSYVGFASAVVSIILAVIVIVYTFYQTNRSEQNISEMRRLIDEGYHTMTDKADLIVKQTESLEQAMAGITQPPTDSDTISAPLTLIKEAGTLDLAAYSKGGLLVLYSLAKSYELRKPISWKAISAELFKGKEGQTKVTCYYGFGVIQSFRAFLGRDDLIWSAEQQELKRLPDGFKEDVIAEIDLRFKKDKDKKDSTFKVLWDLVNNYFDNL